ncbi:GNAT family N-acetyltransferase [Streptomyces daliensis]|uniref:GNAT family N-acetyltransferase n=1 Tax=Streptomyces daliensis TaxID=299421 RepID=A0A8T4J4M5_9ACTN|nr:GNAT family N-acetyltransferase [Streptomyces daliensis]
MSEEISYTWRDPLTDEEMTDLTHSHGGDPVTGWWNKTKEHSLGWVGARNKKGTLVGFVNVAWDGADHAFLIDTKTRGTFQHRGIATTTVRLAAAHARAAGCEWLHVDFTPELSGSYLNAYGFRPTNAGLIHLPSTT